MRKRLFKGLVVLITAASLVGCSASTDNSASTAAETEDNTQDETTAENSENEGSIAASEEETVEETSAAEETTEPTLSEEEIAKAEEEARLKAEEEKKLAEQRNSFSMMYYLAITAEEIRTSKDNRLVLEDIYTSLLNDINPGAIDEITQDHLKNLRDIIKSYLNIETKRERLQFIYNQEKAAAMRSAVPNPLAILNVTNAFDWTRLAMSIAYTAVDSYNSYKQASESADMEFIMSGWELDDEEKETVMKNRDRAFDYMVDMVQEYHLDGLKTLNEKAIEKFAEISATENASERIKLLLAEESQYNLLGKYWLELADAYFETEQYEKCLECVAEYNTLATGIYRKDYNYLQILPKAIVAAQKTYTGDQYVEKIAEFADAIMENTSTDDWSVRYFAAEVYLDLYSKTNEQAYLDTAYKIASENVTVLLKEQRSINDTYLAEVVKQTATEPDYRYMTDDEKKEAEKEYKEEKKRVKSYNKALIESRKTELPAVYEPLVLNCELLFALADQMNVSDAEKADIEAILKTSSNGIFMVKPINAAYSFTDNKVENTIELSKDELIIPADLLTSDSKIVVTVNKNGQTTSFDDCAVKNVKREGTTVDTFKAYVTSKQMKKHEWTADSKITVSITYEDAYDKSADFDFEVSNFEKTWHGIKVEFKAL